MVDRAQLIADIEEARLRLSDLTRELNESPAAEDDPMFGEKLQRVRDCIAELRRLLADAT